MFESSVSHLCCTGLNWIKLYFLDREREGGRERDRQTDRQRDRERERVTERGRETESDGDGDRDRLRNGSTDLNKDRPVTLLGYTQSQCIVSVALILKGNTILFV